MTTKKFKVMFMPFAEEDIDSIYDYISKSLHSPTAAIQLMGKIENNIRRLTTMPFSAPKCMDDTLSQKGYRKLVVENYIIFYIVDEKRGEVIIMRVIYGRRNYEQLV